MKLNDMLAPDPILLPVDPAEGSESTGVDLALIQPASPLAWAQLAEEKLSTLESASEPAAEEKAIAYAFARTAYHRSLDRLRANGWKGFGPVPYSHEPNRAVLRAIAALARAARLIAEDAEYERCRALLSDADPHSLATLLD